MTQTYKVEPLSRIQLDETLREYVCSTCWGVLTFKWHEGKWYAICPECQEETTGYTSKRYAEKRRDESVQEAIEAERNLREILNLHREKRTAEENLHDLGYKDA